jgi:hypothetical protein
MLAERDDRTLSNYLRKILIQHIRESHYVDLLEPEALVDSGVKGNDEEGSGL